MRPEWGGTTFVAALFTTNSLKSSHPTPRPTGPPWNHNTVWIIISEYA